MSFGFSVGDIIQAIELAKKLRKGFVDAPSQFKDISHEVGILSRILQGVEVLSAQNLTEQQKVQLHDIDKGCRSVLDKWEKTLEKYRELSSAREGVRKRVKRKWMRLKWKPEDIRELRSRISSNISLFIAFIDQLTRCDLVKLVQYQNDQERRNLLDWLTPTDYGTQQSDFVSRRQKGTGQWLLDSNEFQRWSNESKQTLFCPGIPGAGKTIITSIIVEHFQTKFQNDPGIGIAYLYCNFRRQQEQKPADLLLSLLKQLVQRLPNVPEEVTECYKCHNKERTRPSFDDISKLLHIVARHYSKTIIIIDALDEYQALNSGRKRLLSEIFNLQAKTGASLFATSRFIPEIQRAFKEGISLEIRASNDDVQRYLDDHMSQLPSFVSQCHGLEKEIKTEIARAVDGMFLLAQLHLESLIGKRSRKAIRDALKTLPKGPEALHHAYKKAMERIEGHTTDSREFAKQVLAWIVCAKRPLSTLELRHALGVEVGESEFDEENLPEIEDIISVCVGLVTVDDKSDIVRLVHYTTQEYFEQTQMTWFPDAQKDIARICITYLSFDTFEAGFCRTDEEFQTRLQQNPLYDYATRNWGHHVRSDLTGMDHLIPNFLDSDAKASAAGQAMRVCENLPGYSQRVPREITGMHLAAHFGIQDVTTLLLESGHNPDAKDSDAQTPLLWAAKGGHEMLVELLLHEKLDVNISDTSRQTTLHYAAGHGWIKVLNLLLQGRADIEARDSQGQTPLLTAAANAQTEAVQLLVNAGANTGTLDAQRRGALHLAISHPYSKLETAQLLLLHNAPADTVDANNMTPLHYTVIQGNEDIAKLLIEHGVPIDIGIQRRTWTLSSQQGCDVYTMASESNAPQNQTSGVNGLTPLHYAALVGSSTMTKFFLSGGADPNALSHYGETPLHLALHKSLQGPKYEDGWTDRHCRLEVLYEFIGFEDDNINEVDVEVAEGRYNVINALLSHHATDVTIQDDKGASLLHAIRYGELGCPFIIPKLLQRGAVVSACNLKKQTALHFASLAGDSASASNLLTCGADAMSLDHEGLNALHYAAQSGRPEMLSCILQASATGSRNIVASRDKKGRNVLHHLLSRMWIDIESVQLLLNHGAEVRDHDEFGNSPLAHYLQSFRPTTQDDICRLLLQHDANALSLNNKGQTLAHLSARCAKVEVTTLKVLMEHGTGMAASDYNGRNLLHYIALSGSLTEASLEFLLDNTTLKINMTDSVGKTALQYAIEKAAQKHHPDLYDPERWVRTREILKKHGAVVAEQGPESCLSTQTVTTLWSKSLGI